MEAKDLLEMKLKKVSNYFCSENKANKISAIKDLNDIFFGSSFNNFSLEGIKLIIKEKLTFFNEFSLKGFKISICDKSDSLRNKSILFVNKLLDKITNLSSNGKKI